MDNITNCLLCGSDKFQTITKTVGYRYAICCTCGHTQQIGRYPIEHYMHLPYESQWNDYDNHCKNRAQYIWDFCEIQKESISSILDIGSGPGGVLHYLSGIANAGIADAVTLDENIPYAYNNITNLIKADYETSNLKKAYDLVTMCHVLEHSLDPKLMLTKALSNLKDNGLLYIEVPSYHWCEMRSNPMFCAVHISYFSKTQLIALIESAGYTVLKSKDSKYWGNIKILARKGAAPRQLTYKENYLWKLLSWKFKKYFVYWIIKLYKRIIKTKPND